MLVSPACTCRRRPPPGTSLSSTPWSFSTSVNMTSQSKRTPPSPLLIFLILPFRASLSLVQGSSPHLSTDQMEDWTTAEAGLFEEAMEKYGKGFNDIWTDFLPWKTVKNIVEYYYMWKTTDRYVQQKRVKAVESEHKLKQVW